MSFDVENHCKLSLFVCTSHILVDLYNFLFYNAIRIINLHIRSNQLNIQTDSVPRGASSVFAAAEWSIEYYDNQSSALSYARDTVLSLVETVARTPVSSGMNLGNMTDNKYFLDDSMGHLTKNMRLLQ